MLAKSSTESVSRRDCNAFHKSSAIHQDNCRSSDRNGRIPRLLRCSRRICWHNAAVSDCRVEFDGTINQNGDSHCSSSNCSFSDPFGKCRDLSEGSEQYPHNPPGRLHSYHIQLPMHVTMVCFHNMWDPSLLLYERR